MRRVWIAAGAMALAACGGGGKEDDGPGGVELVLGGASDDGREFVEVEDGAELPLVAGSQGGFHVWTGLRLQGAAGILYVEREARRASDQQIVLLTSTLVMEVPDLAMEEWWVRPDGDQLDALPTFMCPTPIGIRVRDEPLVLRVQVTTEEEELLAEQELSFVPRCPEGDQAEFCAEICSG